MRWCVKCSSPVSVCNTSYYDVLFINGIYSGLASRRQFSWVICSFNSQFSWIIAEFFSVLLVCEYYVLWKSLLVMTNCRMWRRLHFSKADQANKAYIRRVVSLNLQYKFFSCWFQSLLLARLNKLKKRWKSRLRMEERNGMRGNMTKRKLSHLVSELMCTFLRVREMFSSLLAL